MVELTIAQYRQIRQTKPWFVTAYNGYLPNLGTHIRGQELHAVEFFPEWKTLSQVFEIGGADIRIVSFVKPYDHYIGMMMIEFPDAVVYALIHGSEHNSVFGAQSIDNVLAQTVKRCREIVDTGRE